MNSLTTAAMPLKPLHSRSGQWLVALAAPLVIAPFWCQVMSSFPTRLGTVSGLILVMLLAVCSLTDLCHRKIYNWATYSAVIWALLINLAVGIWQSESSAELGAIGVRSCVLGAMGCFAVMLFAYSLARGGAGDVKMAAAIGALIGFEQGVLAIACSYIVAGVVILAWSIWSRGPLRLLTAMARLIGSAFVPAWVDPPSTRDRDLLNAPVPLAGFFAIGTLIVVLDLPLIP